jgi:hypothetical protein
MASINLAGAIGLGGKRESIISGLPDAINKAGDALNKTIGDELKRQEAERAAKKEKELQLNEMFQKQIKTLIPKDDLHPNDYAELDSEKGKIFAEGFRINSDPTKSYAQKAIELEDLALKFGAKANYARQSWDSFSEQQKEKANPIYDMSIVDKMLQGNYGTQQETVVTDNQTSPERKSYNMSPSVQAENEFANADEMQSAYNREQPQTITTPQKPSIQGKPFFDIPLEQRMKELPVPKQEFANRIKFNQADEKKAFEEFAGVPLGAFTQKLNIDGKDKIVFQQEKFDFEEKALEAALADPSGEGLGKEMRILRATLSTNYFKDLVDKNNIPVEKAQVIAFNYANEVIKDKFKKSVEAAKLDRMKDLDLTAGKSGGQAPTSLTSNDKWAIADPIPVDKMENTLSGQQIEDIEKEVLDKFPDPKEKAYNQTPEQYQAYLKELKSNREKIVEKRKAEETKKMFGGKDVAYVSVQSVGTSQNPTQPFAIGKGIADGVYIDQKTNEILGFGVSTIESDGSKGEFSFERATPEKVIDYKTNLGVVKGTGKNLWESKYPKKSVSLQSGSEKKEEGYTKKDFPWAKVGDVIKAEGQTYKWNGSEWRATDKTSPLSSGDLEKDTQEAKKFGAKYFNNYRETKKAEAPKKKEAKKATIIEGKTIPAGGVPKYSAKTGKLIGYELNGEKYKF